jgi:hypothetical protein
MHSKKSLSFLRVDNLSCRHHEGIWWMAMLIENLVLSNSAKNLLVWFQ